MVELPAFNVSADRIFPPLEKWRYVSVPGYEIISNASEKNTRLFVQQFYLLQQVTQALLPHAEAATTQVPTYIVLCGKGNAFDHFTPPNERDVVSRPGSLFLGDTERSAIVVDYSMSDIDAQPFKNFQKQYFRHIVRLSMGNNVPFWVEEGLSGIFETLEFDKNYVSFAKVEGASSAVISPGSSDMRGSAGIYSGSRGASGAPAPGPSFRGAAGTTTVVGSTFNTRLYRKSFIPMNTFFSLTPGELSTLKTDDIPIYRDQAALFTHMCLYGMTARKKYTEPYVKLVQKATEGPITEEIFQACFKRTYKQMLSEMRAYISITDHRPIELNAVDGRGFQPAPPLEINFASDSDSSRIAGEILRLSGSQTASLNRLIAPYVRGERDAELLAALGLAELYADHTDRARKFLEAAAAAKTTRARALFELGKLRLAEASSKASSENRTLTTEEFRHAIAPLNSGLKQPPPIAELYQTLATAWRDAPIAPAQTEFSALIAGAMRFPKDLKLVHSVAETALKHGYIEEGRALVAHGMKFAPDDATREHFTRLSAKLPVEKKTASLR